MALDEVTRESIEALLNAHSVLLFMKGTRAQPQCGFSAATVSILDTLVSEYETVDVLADATLREGIKTYGQWPTVPQLYVNGELIGGCDIVTELFESGELFDLLGLKPPDHTVPKITFSDNAAAAVRHALDQQRDEMSLHVRIDAGWRTHLELAPTKGHEIRADANDIAVLMDPSTAQRANGLFVGVVETLQGSDFTFENPNAPPAVKQMDVSTLNANIEAGEPVYLFDVRDPDERAKAQIKAAAPFDEAAERLIETLPKDIPLVFHCHGGGRSQLAAERYRLRGFVNVYNLAGGIDAWSLHVDPTVPRY
jgi:monothiol glutaredoxin